MSKHTFTVLAVAALLAIGLTWPITRHRDDVPRPSPSATPTATLSSAQASTSQAQMNMAAATQKLPDVSNWQTLNSKHGWSVRYPPSWQALAVEASNPEEAFQPILSGPKGCDQQDQECGSIQLGSGWRPLSPQQAGLSAKEALLETVGDPRFILLQQGDTVLGDQPAYFVVYRLKLYEDYPNGLIFKEVETKYRNQFYFIVFHEEGRNRVAISAIKSPDGWALNPIFEALVSSFKLTAK